MALKLLAKMSVAALALAATSFLVADNLRGLDPPSSGRVEILNTAVPEPTTLLLLGSGLLGFGAFRFRKRKTATK